MKRICFVFSVLFCFAAQAASFDISTGSLLISESGSWEITGSTHTNSITIEASGHVNITLKDLIITNVPAAISILEGRVNMTLTGSNTVVSTEAAGIYVDKNASLAITAKSTGSLFASSTGGEGAGIGGNKGYGTDVGTPGRIVINGGTIVAQGANFATGIGGGSHGQANLVINGGSVTALGGYLAAGIGGGYGYEGHAGNITISGGYVKAVGNGKSAGIGCAGGGGHDTYPAGLIVITGGTVEAYASSGAGIGASGDEGDNGRAPQIYISGGSVYGSSSTGSPIGQGAGQSECPEILTKKGGEKIYRASIISAIKDHTRTYDFTVKRNGSDYDYSYKGSGYPETGNLYFYLPNGEYEINSEAGGFAGTIDNADAAFVQSATGEVTVSVEKAPVVIDDNGVTGRDEGGWAVSGLYAHYIIVGTSETNSINIMAGAPKVTLRDVSVTTNAALSIKNAIVTLVLEGSNTLVSTEAAGLYVDKSASLTISEESTGSLYATSLGGEGAGIGGNKGYGTPYGTPGPIVINGGTIFAQGADFGTGIGGGSHGQADLVINGGSVTAVGGYLAAGIGGGYGYEGNAGNITINGGYVNATGDGKSAGIGCGGGGGHDKFPAGLITITGGTIEAFAQAGAGIGASGDEGRDGRGPQIYISGGSIIGYCFGEEIGRGEENMYGPWDEEIMPYVLNKPEGERIYAALLPEIIPNPEMILEFETERKGDESFSYAYVGSGHWIEDDLFFQPGSLKFRLPNGDYVVKSKDTVPYGGKVAGEDTTFEALPEPAAMAALALLALAAFLRRK